MKAHVKSTGGSVLIWAVSKGYRLYCTSPRRRGQLSPEDRVIKLLARALRAKAAIDLKVSSAKWFPSTPDGFASALHVAAAQPRLIGATHFLLISKAKLDTTAVRIRDFIEFTPSSNEERAVDMFVDVIKQDFTDEATCRRFVEDVPMLPLALPFASRDKKTSALLMRSGSGPNLLRIYGDSVVPTHLNALHLAS